MEDSNGKVKGSSKKRLRKPKSLEFVGWGSRNLINFLQSLGKDTTNRISEHEVTTIVQNHIRKQNRENSTTKRRKTYDCDDKLRLLCGSRKINMIKVPDLVEKHYVENQDDSFYDFLYSPEDDEQQKLCPSDKVAKQTKQVVPKPKGTFAAIVSDNIKLIYLRKSLVQELAKTPETFESKVVGTFVRIKKPCQLVHVTGVKEGNPIDGHILQVTNYSYYLEDVTTSVLSDDDFSQEECEELHQRIKNGCAKRLTVVDMEDKVRSLHEDVTQHWLARELKLLERLIIQANEKGWRRELHQYLEKRELLNNPAEQARLLLEVPEVVAEELEPECVDDDGKIENESTVPNPEASIEAHQSHEEQEQSDLPVSSVQKTLENSKLCDGNMENDFIVPNPDAFIEANQSAKEQQLSDSPVSSAQKILENSKLRDGEGQPTRTASAGDKDLYEDAEEQPENGITQNKDSISEGEMYTKVTPLIDLVNESQTHLHPPEIIKLRDDDVDEEDNRAYDQLHPPEIIELSDDDVDEEDNRAYEQFDAKKVMWFYEFPEGKTHGPFALKDLKRWSDEEFFVDVPDFKVWMAGESNKSAVLLTKLLPHI